MKTPVTSSGWLWVPGVYFAEGLPFAVATAVSMVIFTTLGMSNSSMTFWTGIIGLPWSLKFLWAPFLDSCWTKRAWMLSAQFVIGLCFAATALTFQTEHPALPLIVGLFLLTAFVSATHDIAADGYYMLALSPHDQAACSGLRNIFYKCAMLAGQGGLVMLAGRFQDAGRTSSSAWLWPMAVASAAMFLLFFYHLFTTPAAEHAVSAESETKTGFAESFRTFFAREGAVSAVLFLFFYRFAEAQLGKLSIPFMLAPRTEGGLGLSLSQQGTIYGIAGTICFLAGGFLAGIAVSRFGFGRCLWFMALALNLPDLFYVYLSFHHPGVIPAGICIALEQFGYGLGYMAHVLFMVQFANRSGKYKTSHFAFMTGIAILGMTLVGMFSGKMQELFVQLSAQHGAEAGYRYFFLWICLCTVPSFLSVHFAGKHLDAGFGKNSPEPESK